MSPKAAGAFPEEAVVTSAIGQMSSVYMGRNEKEAVLSTRKGKVFGGGVGWQEPALDELSRDRNVTWSSGLQF